MNLSLWNAVPLLPYDSVQYLSMHLGWGVVLAAALLCGLRHRGLRARGLAIAVVVLAIAWNLLPGAASPMSPAYWLGLAFQAPSLVTCLLCAWYLLHALRDRPIAPIAPPLRWLGVAGIAAGWLLVFDMLAWLPWSLYSAGFQPALTAVLVLLALLPWIIQGRAAMADARNGIAPMALVLFVLTRAPSGNAWDAVLDPGLWLGLQVWLLRTWRR